MTLSYLSYFFFSHLYTKNYSIWKNNKQIPWVCYIVNKKGKKEGERKQVRESSSTALLLELARFLGPGLPWADQRDHRCLGLLGLKLLISYLSLWHKVASEPVLALALAGHGGEQEAQCWMILCGVKKHIYIYIYIKNYKVGQLACWILVHQAPPKAAGAKVILETITHRMLWEYPDPLHSAYIYTHIYICMQETFQIKFQDIILSAWTTFMLNGAVTQISASQMQQRLGAVTKWY